MGRPKINHVHGDSGTEPSDGTNFKVDDIADPQIFDWLFDTVPTAIDALSAEFDQIDSDGDGIVDKADSAVDAEVADTANLYKNNDIDSDGDGIVDKADSAVDADTVDGQDFADIQTWVNNNADVPNADYSDTAGNANKLDGESLNDVSNSNKLYTKSGNYYTGNYDNNELITVDSKNVSNAWLEDISLYGYQNNDADGLYPRVEVTYSDSTTTVFYWNNFEELNSMGDGLGDSVNGIPDWRTWTSARINKPNESVTKITLKLYFDSDVGNPSSDVKWRISYVE